MIPGVHPFTVTSQFTVTGVLAIISFSIVLIVGFWRHGFHFFSLFVPHGTPFVLHAADRSDRVASRSWCARSASRCGCSWR